MIAVIVIVVIVLVLALLLVTTYNGMVNGRNKVDESWSGIDVQLKRRHDLVPNLVETVKGYATHEREVFEAVTDARARAMSASTPGQAGAAEGQLGQALGRLFAVAEAYPELKASQNFLELQGTLNQLESEIAASRRVYNSNVQTFNTRIQSFPGVVLAGPFGFSRREFFVIENAADREPVNVSFSTRRRSPRPPRLRQSRSCHLLRTRPRSRRSPRPRRHRAIRERPACNGNDHSSANDPVTSAPAGSYVPITTPVVETVLSASLSPDGTAPSENNRLPEPRTTGKTHRRYSSTSPVRRSVWTRSPLPCTCSSGPSCCLSAAIPSAASPSIRTQLLHSSAGRLLDATCLVASFSGLAPGSSVACGQCAAKMS